MTEVNAEKHEEMSDSMWGHNHNITTTFIDFRTACRKSLLETQENEQNLKGQIKQTKKQTWT